LHAQAKTKAQISPQNPQFPSISFSPSISLTLPIYPLHPPPLIAMSPSLLLLNNNLSPQNSSASFHNNYTLFFPTPFMSSLSSQKHKKERNFFYKNLLGLNSFQMTCPILTPIFILTQQVLEI